MPPSAIGGQTRRRRPANQRPVCLRWFYDRRQCVLWMIHPSKSINVRSYSMQPQLGCYKSGVKHDVQAEVGYTGYLPVYKDTGMSRIGPSQTIVFADENNMINDGFIGLAIKGDRWWDVPASWHSSGCMFSLADGHVDYWKWRDGRTIIGTPANQPNNDDLKRVQAALGYD